MEQFNGNPPPMECLMCGCHNYPLLGEFYCRKHCTTALRELAQAQRNEPVLTLPEGVIRLTREQKAQIREALPNVPRDHYREDKRINPFIQLTGRVGKLVTIRVDRIDNITESTKVSDVPYLRVSLRGEELVYLQLDQLGLLQQRITQYYGGTICPC